MPNSLRHRPACQRLAALLVVSAFLLAAAGTAPAAVTVYTDAATFTIDTNAGVVADFEGRSTGPTGSFAQGGVTFMSHPPLDNLYIIDGTFLNTNPLPASQALTGNGVDDFDLLAPAGTYGFGFDTITNDAAPPVVTVYDADGSVLISYTLTQGPNTAGFVGFLSTTPIAKVRWQTEGGESINTAIDNVRINESTVAAEGASFGAVKSLFR